MLNLKAWTIIVLKDPQKRKVLLLKRAPDKKIFPNLITGIGGHVEMLQGECDDIQESVLRELEEESAVKREHLNNLQARLVTLVTEHEGSRILYWFTATLKEELEDLRCPDGVLQWYEKDMLPDSLTPTAAKAIPFILGLSEEDKTLYDGVFTVLPTGDMQLHVATT